MWYSKHWTESSRDTLYEVFDYKTIPYSQRTLSLNKDKKLYANERTKEQVQKNQEK